MVLRDTLKTADVYVKVSLAVWLAATVDALGGLMGFWSVVGDARELVLIAEFVMMLVLLINCYALKNWIVRHTDHSLYRQVAWLSVGSLVLCILGDLVNFNLPESYYRYGQVVKHDYLADSVWFFAPGYLLLLIAAVRIARANGLGIAGIAALLAVAGIIGGVSINAMHLPGTGTYVSAITGFYGIFITVVGASGIVFMLSFGKRRFRPGVLLVSVGILMAAVADSVIGQFWIYGNGGEGFFPAARYVNWSLYVGSQCLVIHLARVAYWNRPCS
ncbi:hypothetical protein [Marinobacter sp. CHS3-4]|uniref:hypothetical protein n=1 Tax=Marinobacter sp. CHS3-4 TaxID=3045174 RepID=UPI0024B53539|nr:hypothetical protein [Marinobacter sp. CHS3-4]MDI9244715.1 hypothetical protein [Marinobacter sp. CHS3-4]